MNKITEGVLLGIGISIAFTLVNIAITLGGALVMFVASYFLASGIPM